MPELLEKVRSTGGGGGEELIELYHRHDLGYVPNGGSLDLRRDIARAIYGDELSAEDHVLVFPGGQIAIQTAALAFANDGCHSIVFTPGYQSAVQSPRWAAGNGGVTEIPRLPEDDWQVDPAKLREAIRPDTRFLILNEPHNPGGVVMTSSLQREVIGICRERSIIILCDEVYRLLEHDADLRLPTMANAYERGISVVAMSKPWGGCGINIGWLACRDADMVRRMADVQYFGCACVSRASEIQARMVLSVSEIILKERMGIILENKGKLVDFIEGEFREWFEWSRPNAGAIAFVKFKGPWTSEVLGKHLAEEAGISIKPAYCFADDTTAAGGGGGGCGGVENYFRIGYGEKKIAPALEALREFVVAHEAAWRRAPLTQSVE